MVSRLLIEKRKNSMKTQVLFIQGGGEGAYAEDEKLAVALQEALGTEYQVSYPRMPDEESPEDKPWMDRLLIILQPLHLVDFGGMAVKVTYSIAGVLPGLLAISGFVIWRYRKPVQQKRTSKKLTPMTV